MEIYKMEIYGFIGNMGCGKNYIAEKLFLPKLTPKPTLVMAFADHFKVTAICFENLDYHKVFGEKDEFTRKKLQALGTELGRDKYGDDIWLRVIHNWMKVYNERGIERFIITDVRFENEVNFIKSLGGKIIKIEAPDRNLERLTKESNGDENKIKELASHRSETYIKEFMGYDYIIDNTKNNIGRVDEEIYNMIQKL
jgi:dephospho-CoA kinase